jgi:hypothetical protein
MFTILSKRHGFASIIAFLFLGGWVTAQDKAPPAEKQPASKDAEKLQTLLKERRDEAQKVVDLLLVIVKNKLAQPDVMLLEASRILLLAELDLTDKPKDRIALHEKYVERAKEVEDVAKLQSAVGKADSSVNPITQACRCEAEIGLLREKAGDKPSAKQSDEIKKVLGERRDALREAVKINDAKIHGNQVIPDSRFFELLRQLARVELELADDAKERVATREEYVKRTKEYEKIADDLRVSGRDQATSPSARALRCDAEVGLLRQLTGDNPSAEETAQIKKLLAARRDALRDEYNVRYKITVGNGLLFVDPVGYPSGTRARILLATLQRLLQAELEYADKPEERASAFRDRLKDLEEIEGIAARRESAGNATLGFHAQAKAACLEIEIALLRERMKAKPPEK